jgi:zinc protease
MFKRLLVLLLVVTGVTGCSHSRTSPSVVDEGLSDFFGNSKVHRYRLANGLKILVLEDHTAPTVAYQTWYKVGSRDEQKGLTGLAHLFEHMMFKATKNLKEGEYMRLLEGAGAEGLNASTSNDYTDYVQALPKDKLEMIANLESDRMVNLLVDNAALTSEREVVQNERRMRTENNPDGLLFQRLEEVAYKMHSYQWPVIGYEADLVRASQKDCESFYKRFYAPNNATIAVVGDVDAANVVNLIDKKYGKLPSSKIDRRTPPVEPEQEQERSDTLTLKSPVEKLLVGYHTVNVQSIDMPALEVLRILLGEGRSSRLYKALVDGEIATNVEVENPDHIDPSMFRIFANMQKGKTAQQALAVIDHEIKKIASGKVTQEELDRAIAMGRFQLLDGLGSNMAKAQFLGYYETVAGRFERGVDIAKGMRAVNKKALVEVARRYLRKTNRSVIFGKTAEAK